MPRQAMALGVQPVGINPVAALGQGMAARQQLEMGQQQMQMNNQQMANNNIVMARDAMRNIGSLAFGVMGGKLDGAPDPQRWEEALDMLGAQGMDVQAFRGRADLAPVVAKASVDTLGLLNNDLGERELDQRIKEFGFKVMEAAKGPAQEFGFMQAPDGTVLRTEKTAGTIEPLGNFSKPDAPGARPLTQEERGQWGIPESDTRPYSIEAGKRPEPIAVQGAPEPGGAAFDVEGKLRGEYQGGPGYKDFIAQEQSYQRVLDSAKDASPAGDLALIFNYMKVLDPGSVVRESEFATAAASGSFGDRIKAAADQILNGKRLSPEQRRDFVQRAGDLFSGASQLYSAMNDRYSTLANEYGVDASRVVRPGAQIGVLSPDFSLDRFFGEPPAAPQADTGASIGEGTIIENESGERMILRNGQWEAYNG